MINILVLEDNEFLLKRMLSILNEWSEANCIVGVTTNSDCAMELKSKEFDVFLVDLDLPDGTGNRSIELFLKIQPAGLPIVISALTDTKSVLDALKLGAVGYIQKDDSSFGVIESIEMARSGCSPMSPLIAREVIKSLHSFPSVESKKVTLIEALTPREVEVISLISKGLFNDEIADYLMISKGTVPVHIRNIYKKLQAKNRTEAVFEARSIGIIT